MISLDPTGQMAFKDKYYREKGTPQAHVIEVLPESVTQDVLAYLRSKGISYLSAGVNRLDCALMLHKLRTIFYIERLMVAGGGIMSGFLLLCRLIDELSLVLSPLIEGRTKEASLVEHTRQSVLRPVASFCLEAAGQNPQAASIMEAPNGNSELVGQILKKLLLLTAYVQPNATVTG